MRTRGRGLKIICYVYDSVRNPILGGGGVQREVNLHAKMAGRHSIRFYSGAFPGAKPYAEGGMEFRFLGLPRPYLLSRITFALLATLHSLFARADLYVVSFSVYSPVLTFLFRPSKTVIQFYHFTGGNAVKKYGPFGWFAVAAETLVLSAGRHFITLADETARALKENYGKSGVAAYVGVDEHLRTPNPPRGEYLLAFGRIDVHMKGLDRLFDIFEAVAKKDPMVRLVIAGRGVQSNVEYVEQRIRKSPYGTRVSLELNPDARRKHELFLRALLLIIPSRFEGWNIVALEAAAHSRPSVGSRIPGLSEAILDNVSGFLCTDGKIEEYAGRVLQLMSDPELYASISKKAYDFAKRFSWDNVAEIQEAFYLKVLGEKG